MPLQEEKKAKEEKDALIAAAKKRGAEKAKLTKSLIIMDVKPWDDTTGALPCIPICRHRGLDRQNCTGPRRTLNWSALHAVANQAGMASRM